MGCDSYFIHFIPIYHPVFICAIFDLDIFKHSVPISHHKQEVLKDFFVLPLTMSWKITEIISVAKFSGGTALPSPQGGAGIPYRGRAASRWAPGN